MSPKILLIAVLAVASLAVIIYILHTAAPRGGAGVVITREECRGDYPHWAPQSTRSYALQYDKEELRVGEPLHVKLWVLNPSGAGEAEDTVAVSLNSLSFNFTVKLERRAMYLERCLSIVPRAPGQLSVRWRNMEARVTVKP